MTDYFEETKKKLEEQIPDYTSPDFRKIGDKIRKELKKEETDLLILIRSLKILVLGDWYTVEKKTLLVTVKNTLLKNGFYAETIEKYYDMRQKGGLSQEQILETCCINHQLIVFIDGDGKGTITEQNYLRDNYIFHGKTIFFIEQAKFDAFKDNPSEYMKDFPTIIAYKENDLPETILIFSRLRLYRLATIIKKQTAQKRGLHGSKYQSWKRRLGYR
ncbi:MAG: hypothetical protein HY606_11970 [Planctomycetes bacterium]|nr:hypothetical protein [Planctomycetota bacterium]